MDIGKDILDKTFVVNDVLINGIFHAFRTLVNRDLRHLMPKIGCLLEPKSR